MYFNQIDEFINHHRLNPFFPLTVNPALFTWKFLELRKAGLSASNPTDPPTKKGDYDSGNARLVYRSRKMQFYIYLIPIN